MGQSISRSPIPWLQVRQQMCGNTLVLELDPVEAQRVQDRGERLHDHQHAERGGKPDSKAAKHDQALHSREKPGAGQAKHTTTP